MNFADWRSFHVEAVRERNISRHLTRRAIDNDSSALTFELSRTMQDGKRQCAFFADVIAVLVDDRQPVGIRINRECHIAAALLAR